MKDDGPMFDEWLEEVDASDVVVSRRRRSEIHRLGLRHRAVHVLLFDPGGRIFLQKRSMRKDSSPGLWDTSAAGHVEPGETYEQCARRELMEELGIAVERLEFLFKMPASADTGWEFIAVFRGTHAGPLSLQASEIDDGVWMTLDELARWERDGGSGLTGTFRHLWRRFLGAPASIEAMPCRGKA